MLLAILVAFCSGPCDTIETSMYNIASSLHQIRNCSCVRRSDFDGFRREFTPTLKTARKCPGLEGRADSLLQIMRDVRSSLR
jgi:hypothetical protein